MYGIPPILYGYCCNYFRTVPLILAATFIVRLLYFAVGQQYPQAFLLFAQEYLQLYLGWIIIYYLAMHVQ